MNKITIKIALLAVMGLLTSGLINLSQAQETEWRAGTATADITPERPMRMAGYGGRNDPFEEVAQPLYAKVLVLEDDRENRFVMVTTDLIGILRELREDVEAVVQDRYGIGSEYLFMNASHTHSGPEYRKDRGNPAREVNRYNRLLRERIIDAIGEALVDLSPAGISYAHAKAGFAMNRRADYSLSPSDPYYGNRYNAAGPVDHDVPVLIVEDEEGSLKSLVFGYACHNTTLGTLQINGDYAGFAQEILEETHPGVTALFVLGTGADQNPHPRGSMVPGIDPLEMARLHGRTLALSVEAALNAHPREVEGPIRASFEKVDVDFIIPSREDLVRLTNTGSESDRSRAHTLLQELDEGTVRRSYDYPVQVVRFGNDLTLVGLGSEVVVDYSLRLKREIEDPAVWVAGYSNDYAGYIPSRRVLLEGGYEADVSGWRPGYYAPDIEERIIGKVHDLHGRLAAGGGSK